MKKLAVVAAACFLLVQSSCNSGGGTTAPSMDPGKVMGYISIERLVQNPGGQAVMSESGTSPNFRLKKAGSSWELTCDPEDNPLGNDTCSGHSSVVVQFPGGQCDGVYNFAVYGTVDGGLRQLTVSVVYSSSGTWICSDGSTFAGMPIDYFPIRGLTLPFRDGATADLKSTGMAGTLTLYL